MRKSFGAKAICYPMPVFIIGTYNADGTPNAMNAAWGGISEETEITICVDAGHKTAENLMTRKAFTVSMATANHVAACDYVGLVSGNKEPDKFAKAGFHATKSEYVDAPLIDELPMALECEVISYDAETCRLVGRIVNVAADESVLGENGKVDVGKLRPITFDTMNNQYLILGEKVGQAFHDGVALKYTAEARALNPGFILSFQANLPYHSTVYGQASKPDVWSTLSFGQFFIHMLIALH